MAGKTGKILMNVAYNIGAAVVIVGALFKLTHWPGADILLTVGLLTEAGLFLMGCFEKIPHDEVDWTIVYPELKTIKKRDKRKQAIKEAKADTSAKEVSFDINELDTDAMSKLAEGITKLNNTANNLTDLTDATIVTQNYIENIGRASESAGNMAYAGNQTAEALSGAAEGMVHSYSEAAESVNNMAQANLSSADTINSSAKNLSTVYDQMSGSISQSTSEMNDTIKNTTSSIVSSTNGLFDNVNSVSNVVVNSAQSVADAYQKTSEALTDSNSRLISGYEELSGKIVANFDDISAKANNYADEMNNLNKNLAALNSAYDFQIQHSNSQLEIQKDIQQNYNKVLEGMSETINSTTSYRSNVNDLTNKVQALNDIYGGMLSVMNNKN